VDLRTKSLHGIIPYTNKEVLRAGAPLSTICGFLRKYANGRCVFSVKISWRDKKAENGILETGNSLRRSLPK
jgi:hypothetical protein